MQNLPPPSSNNIELRKGPTPDIRIEEKKNAILEIKEEDVKEPEDKLQITKVPDPGKADEMGKMNILQWVRTNMRDQMGDIAEIVPQKMLDDKGHAQWQLLDVKDPNNSKAEPKTYLETQVFWVIKLKGGGERVATQFLKTSIQWPKENAAEQLEALRRATLAIDLYTHTMARPLNSKVKNDLPAGFKFDDLVSFNKLYVGVGTSGPLKGRVKVEISTPEGEGSESRGISYTLIQKIDGVGKTILGSSISFDRIDRSARHAVVKGSEGRLANPEGREAYKTDKEREDILNRQEVSDKKLEKLEKKFNDPVKREKLLELMETERSNHVIDFNLANEKLLAGSKNPLGVKWARVKNAVTKETFKLGPTEQQGLQRYLDYKNNVDEMNDYVDELSERIDGLEKQLEDKKLPLLNQASIRNRLDAANLKHERLSKELDDHKEIRKDEFEEVKDLLLCMEGNYEFLNNKKGHYQEMVLKVVALAARVKPSEIKDQSYFKKLLAKKEVREKLSPIEKHFIEKVQDMDNELLKMEKSIDEVKYKLGLLKKGDLGVVLEEDKDFDEDFEGDDDKSFDKDKNNEIDLEENKKEYHYDKNPLDEIISDKNDYSDVNGDEDEEIDNTNNNFKIEEKKDLEISPVLQEEINKIGEIATRDKMVAFYKTGPTEFLGNFSPCNIRVFDHDFKCAEAAFQWRKYDLIAAEAEKKGDKSLRNLLNQQEFNFFEADGQKAFEISQELEKHNLFAGKYVSDWQKGGRDVVMWEVLNVKFAEGTDDHKKLKATGRSFLLEKKKENTAKGDVYWSNGGDGKGANMLGRMLAAIRNGENRPASVRANSLENSWTVHWSKKPIGYPIY